MKEAQTKKLSLLQKVRTSGNQGRCRRGQGDRSGRRQGAGLAAEQGFDDRRRPRRDAPFRALRAGFHPQAEGRRVSA